MSKLFSRVIDASNVVKSHAYKRSKQLAKGYIQRPDELYGLINKVQKRSEKSKRGVFAECKASLLAFCRLLKAYGLGQYREVPWDTLVLMTSTLLYFIMPFDFLPDFVFALGLIDDAALIGWTLKAVKGDIDQFIAWEEAQQAQTDQDAEELVSEDQQCVESLESRNSPEP